MLSYLDKTVERLFAGLKERGVEECVNVIIVSDHGMAPFDSGTVIRLKKVSLGNTQTGASCRLHFIA